MGIRGNALMWIKSYLANRRQFVSLVDSVSGDFIHSDLRTIISGVPEGSILGPVLFLCYINDLPKWITQGTTTLFADDTTIVVTAPDSKSLSTKINAVIEELNTWLNINVLKLNVDKSLIINFFQQNYPDSYEGIKCGTEVKFLGLMVDQHFTWFCHLEYLSKKLNTAIYTLRSLKSSVSLEILKTCYYSYFYSIMSYGICFWGSSSKSIQIFKLQKKAIRLLAKDPPKERHFSCRGLFKELSILTLPCLYITQVILYVRSSSTLMTTNSEFHNYNTRQKQQIRIPRPHKSVTSLSPLHSGSKFLNMLPSHIKNPPTKKSFKTALKEFLLTNEFYSTSEFEEYCKGYKP